MGMRLRDVLAATLFVAGATVMADTPATVPALSGKLGTPIQLLNGKDLTGWVWREKGEGTAVKAPGEGAKLEDVWTVKNGSLHDKGTPTGYIRTEASYDNYVLTVEERHVVKGNGGILFAITGDDKVWPHGLEAQTQNGEEGAVRGIANLNKKMDPARTEAQRLKRIGPDPEKAVGEWETFVITVDHGIVTETVNGSLQNIATETGSLVQKPYRFAGRGRRNGISKNGIDPH